MESSDFDDVDDGNGILLDPIFPRTDGRMFRMPMDRFVEIISSFRPVNHAKQCSVETERVDYGECSSLGKVTECAQQTSFQTSAISCQAVETSPVSCQSEAVDAEKLSGKMCPAQRTTVPVIAATAYPVRESRSNSNGHDTVTANARTTARAAYRKALEVISHHVNILKV